MILVILAHSILIITYHQFLIFNKHLSSKLQVWGIFILSFPVFGGWAVKQQLEAGVAARGSGRQWETDFRVTYPDRFWVPWAGKSFWRKMLFLFYFGTIVAAHTLSTMQLLHHFFIPIPPPSPTLFTYCFPTLFPCQLLNSP